MALALVGFLFLPAPAHADCTDPAGKEGEIRFNNAYLVFQGCNGTDWVAFHDPSCAAGDGCDPCLTGPIGTVCESDGAIYAGELSGTRLYAAPEDEGSYTWGGAGQDDDADSDTDGLANTNNLMADGHGHPAAEECRNARGAGWYLPAKDELNVLYGNRGAIDASANQNFQDADYWSSTEYNTGNANNHYFITGNQNRSTKDTSYRVRCVRR